jgi:amidophosphoribosyltransferase
VFDGDYITGDVDQHYLNRIDSQRNDAAKRGDTPEGGERKSQVIGIHNSGVATS